MRKTIYKNDFLSDHLPVHIKKKATICGCFLHQKDKNVQKWYYQTIADYLSDLSEYAAYQEYVEHFNEIFQEG